MRENLVNDLNNQLDDQLADSDGMVKMMAENIFSAIAITTKGFDNVVITFNEPSSLVLAKIDLRWFVRNPKFEKLHQYWLVRAERRAKPFLPKGWRLVIYYNKTNKG